VLRSAQNLAGAHPCRLLVRPYLPAVLDTSGWILEVNNLRPVTVAWDLITRASREDPPSACPPSARPSLAGRPSAGRPSAGRPSAGRPLAGRAASPGPAPSRDARLAFPVLPGWRGALAAHARLRGVSRSAPRAARDARLGFLGFGQVLGARPGHVPCAHRSVRRQLHSRHGITLRFQCRIYGGAVPCDPTGTSARRPAGTTGQGPRTGRPQAAGRRRASAR